MNAPASAGSPITSASARAASAATSSSYTASTTIAREHALHFWPEKPNAEEAMPAAAASTSADAATMAGFLPPISVIAGRANGPSAKRLPSARPTSAEPVKTTPSIAPSASARPVSSPPWTSATTPSGSPAAAKHSPTSAPDSGVCSDGLITTVLPATSAPEAMPTTSATGKLNGPITPNTPNGRRTLSLVSSGVSCPSGTR